MSPSINSDLFSSIFNICLIQASYIYFALCVISFVYRISLKQKVVRWYVSTLICVYNLVDP